MWRRRVKLAMTWGGPNTIEGVGLLPYVAARGGAVGLPAAPGVGAEDQYSQSTLPAQLPERAQGAPGRPPARLIGILSGSWFPHCRGGGRCRGARALQWSLLGWRGP